MTLTETQLVVLSAAAARADGSLLPLPAHIKGGAIAKVCGALVAKGLALELAAGSATKLVVSDAAREVLGIAPEAPTEVRTPAEAKATAAVEARAQRPGTKQAQLIAMLKTSEGANIEEVATTFGWQAHTVRGAIAGALKKKLGLSVRSEAIEGRGRVYRITD